MTVEDPTKVLFHSGHQRMVLRWIPWTDGTRMIVAGIYSSAPGCYNRQDDRLADWLSRNLGESITTRFSALPLVDDCRPTRSKMYDWIMEGFTKITFDPSEKVEPPRFSPTLHFEKA